MIDEFALYKTIANKLKGLFSSLEQSIKKDAENAKNELKYSVDEAISRFESELTPKIDQSLSRADETLANNVDQANKLLDSVHNQVISKAEEAVLFSKKVAAEVVAQASQKIDNELLTLDHKIAESVLLLKKGDDGKNGKDGRNGLDGEDGKDGVGIEKITQPSPDSMKIKLTDGKESLIKLPRGPRGGGVIGSSGSTAQYINGFSEFPLIGQEGVLYFDISAEPYTSYVWSDGAYRQFGGGSVDNATPFYIPESSTFSIAQNKQCLASIDITVDGFLKIDGFLVEV